MIERDSYEVERPGGNDPEPLKQDGPPVRTDGRSDNRGHRPSEGSGVVEGSGAGAGGGGAEEDFDADPVGGGGASEMPADPDR